MRIRLVLIASLAAAALAACGGGESDEDEIADVITTSIESSDPAVCEELSTQNFLEQTNPAVGKEAVEACEEDTEDDSNNPESIEVTDVEVEGTAATANVAFVGGSFDRQTLAVALVEEDGDWKLDEIDGFVELDREALLETLREGFAEAEDLEPELAECLLEAIESRGDEGVELAVFGGLAGLEGLVEECQ